MISAKLRRSERNASGGRGLQKVYIYASTLNILTNKTPEIRVRILAKEKFPRRKWFSFLMKRQQKINFPENGGSIPSSRTRPVWPGVVPDIFLASLKTFSSPPELLTNHFPFYDIPLSNFLPAFSLSSQSHQIFRTFLSETWHRLVPEETLGRSDRQITQAVRFVKRLWINEQYFKEPWASWGGGGWGATGIKKRLRRKTLGMRNTRKVGP